MLTSRRLLTEANGNAPPAPKIQRGSTEPLIRYELVEDVRLREDQQLIAQWRMLQVDAFGDFIPLGDNGGDTNGTFVLARDAANNDVLVGYLRFVLFIDLRWDAAGMRNNGFVRPLGKVRGSFAPGTYHSGVGVAQNYQGLGIATELTNRAVRAVLDSGAPDNYIASTVEVGLFTEQGSVTYHLRNDFVEAARSEGGERRVFRRDILAEKVRDVMLVGFLTEGEARDILAAEFDDLGEAIDVAKEMRRDLGALELVFKAHHALGGVIPWNCETFGSVLNFVNIVRIATLEGTSAFWSSLSWSWQQALARTHGTRRERLASQAFFALFAAQLHLTYILPQLLPCKHEQSVRAENLAFVEDKASDAREAVERRRSFLYGT